MYSAPCKGGKQLLSQGEGLGVRRCPEMGERIAEFGGREWDARPLRRDRGVNFEALLLVGRRVRLHGVISRVGSNIGEGRAGLWEGAIVGNRRGRSGDRSGQVLSRVGRESGAVLNATLEVRNGDPVLRVALEDHTEDVVQLI